MAPSCDQASWFGRARQDKRFPAQEARWQPASSSGHLPVGPVVGRARGGPLRSDWDDFPDTARDCHRHERPSDALLEALLQEQFSRVAQSPSHNNEPCTGSSMHTGHCPGRTCLPSAVWPDRAAHGLLLIRAEGLRTVVDAASDASLLLPARRLVCGLSPSQPGPGNAFRGPLFPNPTAASLAWDGEMKAIAKRSEND